MDQLAAYGSAVTPVTSTQGTPGAPSRQSAASPPPAVAVSVLPAAPKAAAPVAPEALQGVVDGINAYLKSVNRDIQFQVDRTTGNTVVKILDNSSGKVVDQIPSESVMALDLDQVSGLLISAEA